MGSYCNGEYLAEGSTVWLLEIKQGSIVLYSDGLLHVGVG